MRIDLHTHSSVSDGTDPPGVLVEAAKACGLDVVALTDHDTFAGIPEAVEAGRRAGITVLGGVELSTQFDGRSVHLLGYGCRTDDPPLTAELARLRTGRTGRLDAMLDKLADLGVSLTADEVWRQAGSAPSLGRPHVADAMVAKGFVADRDEAFARYLDDDGPAYVPRYATDLADAIGLIHDAGGAAVLAHPWARGSAATLTAETIAKLAAGALDGIEADHPDHDAGTREALRALGARLGLVCTGSSDHHGTGKTNNPLGACTTTEAAYDDLLRRIGDRGGVQPER